MSAVKLASAADTADVLDLIDEIDELDPEELRSMRQVIAKYGDENGLDLDRMRADLAAGTHPYQQPRR
jgi:hypothetical protein